MPELPEVEIIVRQLHKVVAGRTITGFKADSKCFSGNSNKKFFDVTKLAGKTIDKVSRLGKFIKLEFTDKEFALINLGMTGNLLYSNECLRESKHYLYCLFLDDGKYLNYIDVRRFGSISLYQENEPLKGIAAKLGPDALDLPYKDNISTRLNVCKNEVYKPIKEVLLNQRLVAGVGNYLADETLFRSAVNPCVPFRELNADDIYWIIRNLYDICHESIEHGGNTFSDYKHIDGSVGSYHKHMKVYGRAGLPCYQCKRLILKTTIAGRGTSYCNSCQL